MPQYHPPAIEPKWQQFWEANKTFRCPDPDEPAVQGKPKVYILDMFPYPSGAGLHVGHPEGYTATDILSRFKRMRGFHVLHPMGWDAFGLPAEQYAIKNNVHPRVTTQQNISTFRRQIKSLGFSYDWDREVDTTDPDYVKWTQWIFLQLYDTWYDREANKGRPISELPIPDGVRNHGPDEVRRYQDSKRLAYMAEAPVNWCPALGTVVANEEIVNGRTERDNHPVERRPLLQWQLRITEYAERLLNDLDTLDWSDAIKAMQRNWIGRSEGADVDFQLPATPGAVIRVYTTRPDTLYGATYMVLSPEHVLVERITTPDQRAAVTAYQEAAARKSDFERTEVAKTKTGEFTGAYATNPVNDAQIPIWIADYVLASYGTGAIMAVPGHDERDFEFAKQFNLPIVQVVERPESEIATTSLLRAFRAEFAKGNFSYVARYVAAEMRLPPGQQHLPQATTVDELREKLAAFGDVYQVVPGEPNEVIFYSKTQPTLLRGVNGYFLYSLPLDRSFDLDGISINSGFLDGLPTHEAKLRIIAELETRSIGIRRVNYKLRDWLFSRQRYWGEPFPILHEVDAAGNRSGVIRALDPSELPCRLPELEDFKPTGSLEGPLVKAQDWVRVTRDGKQYRRETNTMPQWAGSCWYYLRYLDAKNPDAFCAPAKAKYWLPVDLYVGGAEHAVLHLLYSRFWHKVLFDRGHVPTAEPFQRLINQGMILGEMEYTGFQNANIVEETDEEGNAVQRLMPTGSWVSGKGVEFDGATATTKEKQPKPLALIKLTEEQLEKQGDTYVLKDKPEIRVDARSFKMSKSRGNVVNPDVVVQRYGADCLRLYEMFMGPLEAVKPWSMRSLEGPSRFLNKVWRIVVDEAAEAPTLNPNVKDVEPDAETLKLLHKTIQKVTDDTEGLRFNTAIAAMMEFTNHLTSLANKKAPHPKKVLESFVLLLAPYAPHAAEELWQVLGHASTLAYEPWPKADPAIVRDDEIEIPVMMSGKVKAKLMVPADIDAAGLEKLALADPKVQEAIGGKPVKKVIAKPKQMVSIVT